MSTYVRQHVHMCTCTHDWWAIVVTVCFSCVQLRETKRLGMKEEFKACLEIEMRNQ